MNPTFKIKRGDVEPAISATLKQAGLYMNLTGCSVRLLMRRANGVGLKVDKPAVIVDALLGQVRYDWTAGDVDTEGHYVAEWEITQPGGKVISAPTVGFLQVYVLQDLDREVEFPTPADTYNGTFLQLGTPADGFETGALELLPTDVVTQVLNDLNVAVNAETLARAASDYLNARITVINDTTIRIASLTGGGFVDVDTTTPGSLKFLGPFGRLSIQAGAVFSKEVISILTGGSVAAVLAGSRSLYRVQGTGVVQEITLPAVSDTDGTSLTGATFRLVVYNGAKAYFRATNAAHQVLLDGVTYPASSPQWIVGSDPLAAAQALDLDITFIGSNTWKIRRFEGAPVVTRPGP